MGKFPTILTQNPTTPMRQEGDQTRDSGTDAVPRRGCIASMKNGISGAFTKFMTGLGNLILPSFVRQGSTLEQVQRKPSEPEVVLSMLELEQVQRKPSEPEVDLSMLKLDLKPPGSKRVGNRYIDGLGATLEPKKIKVNSEEYEHKEANKPSEKRNKESDESDSDFNIDDEI